MEETRGNRSDKRDSVPLAGQRKAHRPLVQLPIIPALCELLGGVVAMNLARSD